MNTIVEKALGLIANASTREDLQNIAGWAETHSGLNAEEKDNILQAIHARAVELFLQ